MDFFTTLSTEDMSTGATSSALDVSAVIDADTASSEAMDMVVDIENDINNMNAATLATEHLEAQARNAEAMMQDPQGINANVAKLSFESIEQTASALGFPMEATGVHVSSSESIDNDPVSAMTLSQEGIKEFFKKIIDGIKKIFKKIVVSIKRLVVKLLVTIDGTEKSALALAKKLKESKATGGEDISESDKTKIAKLLGSSIVLGGDTDPSGNTQVSDFTTKVKDTFGDKAEKSAIKVIAAFKAFMNLENNLDDFGLTKENSTGETIFIPFKYTGSTVSGAKILVRESKDAKKFAEVEFSAFKGKLSATVIDNLADKVKQSGSSADLQKQLKTIAGFAGKGKAFFNSQMSLIDNLEKDLDKMLPEDAKGKGAKAANEVAATFKGYVSGIKVAGTSLLLDSVLHYVGTQRNSLAVVKIQAKKFL